MTTFLFGIRDEKNKPYHVATVSMKISADERSHLMKLLFDLLGRAPEFGWNFLELKGSKCLANVGHQTRKDGSVYAVVHSAGALSAVTEGATGEQQAVKSVDRGRLSDAIQRQPSVASVNPVKDTGYSAAKDQEDDQIPF
ncbi:MAG TPA: hypothetical protein EYQ00_02935 [Dehalococcoidia bacterium]|nr:hypothetical protein [Dehalococcoidia bacterium]